jgi:hypothetical protein
LGDGVESSEHGDDGCLACSIGPKQPKDLVGFHEEREPFDGIDFTSSLGCSVDFGEVTADERVLGEIVLVQFVDFGAFIPRILVFFAMVNLDAGFF